MISKPSSRRAECPLAGYRRGHDCFIVWQRRWAEKWILRLEGHGEMGDQPDQREAGGFSGNQEKDRGDHRKCSDNPRQDEGAGAIHAERYPLRGHPAWDWRLAAASRPPSLPSQIWRLQG